MQQWQEDNGANITQHLGGTNAPVASVGGTPFSWQVHSVAPEYEYNEDRESFGMYS